jgi:hypothetical protein
MDHRPAVRTAAERAAALENSEIPEIWKQPFRHGELDLAKPERQP